MFQVHSTVHSVKTFLRVNDKVALERYPDTACFVFSPSPRFELPVKDEMEMKKVANIVCHCCGQAGHKASVCPSNPQKENMHSGNYRVRYYTVLYPQIYCSLK